MNDDTRAAFLTALGSSVLAGCAGSNYLTSAGSTAPVRGFGKTFSGQTPRLVKPVFLMDYATGPDVGDYRPAINANGTAILFERTFAGSKVTNLYLLDLASTGLPGEFEPSIHYTERVDWCWRTNVVAFSNGKGVWTAAGDGTNLKLIPGTAGMIYPAWYPGGGALAVYNDQSTASPKPCTTKIDRKGNVLIADCTGTALFAGFPSVNPKNPNLIAFAGQPIAWNLSGGYDQAFNYVYIADISTTPYTIVPLESAANQAAFDPNYQGRAPYWSPNGQWIAFESNRASSTNKKHGYAAFIISASGQAAPMQVTSASTSVNWGVQHPKWYPDGKKLIAAAFQTPGPKGKYGIARLDVSAFVS
jgi:hypothetical protein